MRQFFHLGILVADKRLLAIVTVLILMGTSGGAQEGPSIDELRTIEDLIEGGDWRALYSYVDSNPNLTAGNGPLATELRSFSEDVEQGRLDQFDAPQPTRQASQSAVNADIY